MGGSDLFFSSDAYLYWLVRRLPILKSGLGMLSGLVLRGHLYLFLKAGTFARSRNIEAPLASRFNVFKKQSGLQICFVKADYSTQAECLHGCETLPARTLLRRRRAYRRILHSLYRGYSPLPTVSGYYRSP